MKKAFLILLCTLSLFAADEEKKPFEGVQPPSIKAPCTGRDGSFVVYKDTICNGSGLDLITLRCVELNIKRVLGFLSDDEVKHYTGETAYLKEKRGK